MTRSLITLCALDKESNFNKIYVNFSDNCVKRLLVVRHGFSIVSRIFRQWLCGLMISDHRCRIV